MKIVMFDLDGTLLPMDQDVFVKAYFSELCKKAAPFGYDPEKLIKGVWAGTGAMVKNNGAKTNEDVFWDTFSGLFGEKALADKKIFNEFYANEFDRAKTVCGHTPVAAELIRKLRAAGIKVVLASNPIFPETAQKKRMQWAGVDPDDFEYITTTLTISPHKNSDKINEIGVKVADEYGLKYLLSDFKKNDGFKRSIELSKEYDLYRQSFCGCEFSKRD